MTEVIASEIPQEGLEVAFAEEASALELSIAGTRFVQPVSAELLLLKHGDIVGVTGRLQSSVMFECASCLREFLATLDIPVTGQFLPGSPSVAAGEHPMPADEAENYYYRDDTIILEDLVRQELLLAIPYRPLCRADCKGLCPQCGQDLNVARCGCAPPPDPRLAALKEYLKKK